MRVGLVRHFKVICKPASSWMTSDEFDQWVADYNCSEIVPERVFERDNYWQICLTSDLYRAVRTAELLYQGDVIACSQLREISMCSFMRANWKLPHIIWIMMARLAWLFSHKSQEEGRVDTALRAKQMIDLIESYGADNTLIVSHGAFMKALSKQLKGRGYCGKGFLKPENGRLYTYEK